MRKFNFLIIVLIMLLNSVFCTTISVNAKSTAAELDSADKTEYFALLIGTDPEIWCDNDADDMANVLINNGWKSENIEKLTKTQATKENFINKINLLDDKEDGYDIVLFFFSGHGGTRCIAFYDEWSGTFNRDAMYLLQLGFYINQLDAKKIILIFDTCHSGSLQLKENPLMRSNSNQYLSKNINLIQLSIEEEADPLGLFGLSGFGRIVIASCGRYEYAYGSPEYQNGYFTYHYVEGLKGKADSNNNGCVSTEEAFKYAKPRTIDDTENNPRTKTQHPVISDLIFGEVDITNMDKSCRYTESNLETIIITFKERFTTLVDRIKNLF